MPPLRATETTAFFAGVWGFIGINATRALLGVPSNVSGIRQIVWVVAFAIFLFIPTYVFVAGIQKSRNA
jgi:hypothetical protein